MKYSTILPAFLFLAGSALLPISSYAGYGSDKADAEKELGQYENSSDNSGGTGDNDDNGGGTNGASLDDSVT